jgi:hypothetical protein
VTGHTPLSVLRDDMTPETRECADASARALREQCQLPKTYALKLCAVGTGMGVVLPDDILEQLQVGEGQNIYAVATTRGIVLTDSPHSDPGLADG